MRTCFVPQWGEGRKTMRDDDGNGDGDGGGDDDDEDDAHDDKKDE